MGVKVILLVTFFCSDGSGWDLFSETYKKCRRVCAGWTFRWTLAHCICVWDFLFFGGCICRICRTVWMEIRNCIHMDWNWECSSWKSFGLGCAREKDKGYESTFTVKDDAGFFW